MLEDSLILRQSDSGNHPKQSCRNDPGKPLLSYLWLCASCCDHIRPPLRLRDLLFLDRSRHLHKPPQSNRAVVSPPAGVPGWRKNVSKITSAGSACTLCTAWASTGTMTPG